jgi:cobalamin biosynthesis protein CobD/CbiB
VDHESVNRWLASVALVLGIVLMGAVLYYGVRVQDALSGLGRPVPPAQECWDPGGGTVCAPGGQDGVPGQ